MAGDELDISVVTRKQLLHVRARQRAGRRQHATTRDRVRVAAGFTAGSIATIGIPYVLEETRPRRPSPCLHATTTAFTLTDEETVW